MTYTTQFKGQTYSLYADSPEQAQQLAARYFRTNRSYRIKVTR
jgi:hypothetical protein